MILLNEVPLPREQFGNGETRLNGVAIAKAMDGNATVTVRLAYESDADLIYLLFIKQHLDHLVETREVGTGPRIVLDVGYMPYSRMDRISQPHEVFTLKACCALINAMHFDHVQVGEAHSDVTTALLDRVEPYSLIERHLATVLKDLSLDPLSDVVVFPDAGAAKRYGELPLPSGIATPTAMKVRSHDTGRITSLDLMAPKGTHVEGGTALIIDDICSFGGTFVLAARALRELGYRRIALFVAHLEAAAHLGKLFDELDAVYATNSLPQSHTNPALTVFPLHDNR